MCINIPPPSYFQHFLLCQHDLRRPHFQIGSLATAGYLTFLPGMAAVISPLSRNVEALSAGLASSGIGAGPVRRSLELCQKFSARRQFAQARIG
jgi:hypothetical protein